MSQYNANVRIGNWYDELILQEEKAKQYVRRSRNGELRVQKVRKLFLSMLREIPLTFPVVGLSYGAVIQIVSPEAPKEPLFKIEAKQGLALAANIDFRNLEERTTFAINDPVIGSGLLTPCVMNVWTLVPHDKTRQGKKLCFGDSFHIRLQGADTPLYVEVASMSPGVPKGESGHVVPKLVGQTSTLTRFKVVNIDPKNRYETEGLTVPPFEKIAIIQAATSECLAVETDTWFPTYFGMECEVSVFTYKDITDPSTRDYRNCWTFRLAST